MLTIKNSEVYSQVLIRISMSLVFLWFGINQLINSEDFLGYLPDFLLVSTFSENFIIFNGIFELILSILLLIGLFTRFASFFLAIHLLGIIISLGYNDIAIRDLGLMLVTFSIFLRGSDNWSLDKWRKNEK